MTVSSAEKTDKNHRFENRRANALSTRPNELAAVLGPIKAKP